MVYSVVRFKHHTYTTCSEQLVPNFSVINTVSAVRKLTTSSDKIGTASPAPYVSTIDTGVVL